MLFGPSSVYMHVGQQHPPPQGAQFEQGDTYPGSVRVRRVTSHMVSANDANLGLRMTAGSSH